MIPGLIELMRAPRSPQAMAAAWTRRWLARLEIAYAAPGFDTALGRATAVAEGRRWECTRARGLGRGQGRHHVAGQWRSRDPNRRAIRPELVEDDRDADRSTARIASAEACTGDNPAVSTTWTTFAQSRCRIYSERPHRFARRHINQLGADLGAGHSRATAASGLQPVLVDAGQQQHLPGTPGVERSRARSLRHRPRPALLVVALALVGTRHVVVPCTRGREHADVAALQWRAGASAVHHLHLLPRYDAHRMQAGNRLSRSSVRRSARCRRRRCSPRPWTPAWCRGSGRCAHLGREATPAPLERASVPFRLQRLRLRRRCAYCARSSPP